MNALPPVSGVRPCECREPDLLMLLHGELGPVREITTRWHLRTCPQCRQQMNLLAAASVGFADVLRGGDLPRSLPPGGFGAPASPVSRLLLPRSPVLLGLFAIVFLMVGTTVYIRRSAAQAQAMQGAARPVWKTQLCPLAAQTVGRNVKPASPAPPDPPEAKPTPDCRKMKAIR